MGLRGALQVLTPLLAVRINRQRWAALLADGDDRPPPVILPNAAIHGADVKRLYGHPHAVGKTGGAMRALIRWWHAPCADFHQELMENGPAYEHVRHATVALLATPDAQTVAMVDRTVEAAMALERSHPAAWSVLRLRRLVGQIAIHFWHEWVMHEPCPPDRLRVLAASTADFVGTVGGMSRGDMQARRAALDCLREAIEQRQGLPAVFGEDCPLTADQRAQYILGVYFHSSVAQIVRLVCNALAHLSRDPASLAAVREEAQRAGADGPYPLLDAALTETLRVTPGVPAINRLATAEVDLGNGQRFPAGTNFVFDLERYHRSGFDDPRAFRPARWLPGGEADRKTSNFMPFGVGRRRCPAEKLTFLVGRRMVHDLLGTLDFVFPDGAGTLFSSTSRISNDLCWVVRREPPGPVARHAMRTWVTTLVTADGLLRSVTQLVVMPRNWRDARELQR